MTDLISRSAVLDRLEMLRRNYSLKAGYRDAMTDAIGEVRGTPSIDAVPVVHAKWNLKHIGVGHYWECSACHINPCIYVTENTKYCPNCGARMDGEREEDTNEHQTD